MVEEIRQVLPPSKGNKSPKNKKGKERKRRGRERKRRAVISSSSSPNLCPVRSPLQMATEGGVTYRDDDFPVLRPAILGVRRRLDIEEPPTETPVTTTVPPAQYVRAGEHGSGDGEDPGTADPKTPPADGSNRTHWGRIQWANTTSSSGGKTTCGDCEEGRNAEYGCDSGPSS
jgi:hypothetical protein